jgi:hypothetical protein
MRKQLSIAFGVIALAAGSALAQTAPCPMTYAAFEFAVPHLDLDKCPADLAREGVFCRASTGHDAVHVFVFSRSGDQCLLALKSYKEGQYEFVVK